MELKEDDLVMCTVRKVEGTTIFIEIEGNGNASLVMYEVAAGRIRNLREYVAPNKKIVCKVLRIINDIPQLSLRRVTGKEKEEMQERYKKEKTFTALFKTIAKDYELIIKKIKEKSELWKFYDEARENPSLLAQFIGKEDAQKLAKLLLEKKEKEKIAKKEFAIKSFAENGVVEIKEILDQKNVDMRYLGSSCFSITANGKDFKEANSKIEDALQQIEKKAKEKKLFFEVKEMKK